MHKFNLPGRLKGRGTQVGVKDRTPFPFSRISRKVFLSAAITAPPVGLMKPESPGKPTPSFRATFGLFNLID
jgi:hypothetical protein